MRKINSLILGLCFSAESMAAPVTLNCFNEAGKPIAGLTVDLDARTLTRGMFSKYDVVDVTENYITAYEVPRPTSIVGGGVLALDRRNGQFVSADVGMFMGENQGPEDAVFGANTHSGTCTKQVL